MQFHRHAPHLYKQMNFGISFLVFVEARKVAGEEANNGRYRSISDHVGYYVHCACTGCDLFQVLNKRRTF